MRKIQMKKWNDALTNIVKEQEEEEEIDENVIVGPVLSGPYGLIPLSKENTPGKNYKFYSLTTNFVLNKRNCKIILNTDGVSAFTQFDKYSGLLLVGKMFSPKYVYCMLRLRLGVGNIDSIFIRDLLESTKTEYNIVNGVINVGQRMGRQMEESRNSENHE